MTVFWRMAVGRCSVAWAISQFDELRDQVIMDRTPIFIEGERRTTMIISMEEYEAIREKLISRAMTDL